MKTFYTVMILDETKISSTYPIKREFLYDSSIWGAIVGSGMLAERKDNQVVFCRYDLEFITVPQNCPYAVKLSNDGYTQLPIPK